MAAGDGQRAWVVVVALAVAVGAAMGGVMGHCSATRAIDGWRGVSDPEKPTVPGMGRLEVKSTPAGAHVFVDGRLVGVTPVERIDVDPGRHAVVLEAVGYQSYTGALSVAAGRAASLEAVLAKGGGAGGGGGAVGGGGDASGGAIAGGGGAVDAGPGGAAGAGAGAPVAAKKVRAAAPPPRPHRDCSGERSTCKDHCDDASFDCTSRCQYCGSCVSNMTWDECNRICNTCKQGCEQNVRFCESSCESQYDSCSSME